MNSALDLLLKNAEQDSLAADAAAALRLVAALRMALMSAETLTLYWLRYLNGVEYEDGLVLVETIRAALRPVEAPAPEPSDNA